ncbi:hypothetical protein H5P28_12275 [Ruficoccus amylovorans]|uniref:Flagellar protein FlgJ N-terminal domain-containing protein n=1 Tax=Ruficoccus amylovorans TaxID=1804625 RepID=A0A842HEL9_9BACT|nr:hypothetical protein [Ruficoccus amylovorans]MBC2595035.1 hypothetical protein [Ruficoccus amylovorans]
MNPVTPSVTASSAPASQPGDGPPVTNLAEASQQFEAVFLRQFLGDALKPLLSATPEGEGGNAHVYQYMVTQVLSDSLAEREVFGLATLLQHQLSGFAEQDPSPSNQNNQ